MVKEIERLADLLNIAIVSLKEIGRPEELSNGSLRQKIQRKIHEQMQGSIDGCLGTEKQNQLSYSGS